MEVAIALAIVNTIMSAIQFLDKYISKISFPDCKKALTELESTVNTVKSVLEDAETKQDAISSQERHYIQALKDAVYDANDVLDEFVTLVKQGKISKEHSNIVTAFLSRLSFRDTSLTNKVKNVKTKLDAIALDTSKFLFKIENKPVKFRNLETSSYVLDNTIIGRDRDVDDIIGMLLLTSNDVDQPNNNVSSLAIVGMGGLGKTALAQLVYKHPKVTSAFQLHCWICIGDQDPKQWNLAELLGKVLRELNKGSKPNLITLEQIRNEIRDLLKGKKYLLVLDDVWTDDYGKWLEFEQILKVGERGSQIVVTTRSKKVAKNLGGQVYELQGLAEKESWRLFERMSFTSEQIETPDYDLVILGNKIVKKCKNVPLAVKLVGSLLRYQSTPVWEVFENRGISMLNENDDTMNQILKLSYHQLVSPLKSCFAYCAIFPKNFEIDKRMLISLWMAQGYVNVEYEGEEYIRTLLQRCFFQDVVEDKWGEVDRFKIHDLLHDVAEQVAGEEVCILNSDPLNVSNKRVKVRHISLLNSFCPQKIKKTRIRTCHQVKAALSTGSSDKLLVVKSISKWRLLRSLDLSGLRAEYLPESIRKLRLLRYLNLSGCDKLKSLPKTITKLVNLQTLDLSLCPSFKELPIDVSKLVDLSTLNVTASYNLSHMPSDLGKLTNLHTLGRFVVGRESPDRLDCFNGLKELQSLNNLKGQLDIRIGVLKNATYVKKDHGGGAYLRSKKRLARIVIEFIRGIEYGSPEQEQALVEEMQPHHDLVFLKMEGYHGETIPRWPRREDNSALFHLPKLVTLVISRCKELLCLPWQVGKLPLLKQLKLLELSNMEHVVNANPEASASGEGPTFFPCLEELEVIQLPKLEGWWPRSGSGVQDEQLRWESSPYFPQLNKLNITHCPMMTSIPLSSHTVDLLVQDSSRNLIWHDLYLNRVPQSSQHLLTNLKLMTLTISQLDWLQSMPVECFQRLGGLLIQRDKEVESLGDARKLFQTDIFSSMLFVQIVKCPKLRTDGGWLSQLFALHSLVIFDCPNIVDGIPWRHLPKSLQRLCLEFDNELVQLEELPNEMQYCTSLEYLTISYWPKLHSLPNWLPELTGLREFLLRNCSQKLKERCQPPDGEDWSLVQHIPRFSTYSTENYYGQSLRMRS